jgi:pyruvate/2-oxoglutarate dehydrogenase complex dihydrolipoamide dehydrogenase (E3) component
MAEQVDVVVVGMGPGGEAVAGQLAEAGLSVVAVESGLVGGECPYYGCIPSKMMIRATNLLAEAGRVNGMAGSAEPRPAFAPVADRIRQTTDNWNDEAAARRFEGQGGRLVRGRARIVGERTVRVGEAEFTATRALVLNPGTEPTVPSIPGLADTPFWTNREALRATEAPASLCVVGGGPIGLELGQAFARFGTRVTVVEAADRLLSAEEPQASELITGVVRDEGLDVRTGAKVTEVGHDGSGFTVRVDDETVTAERLLIAVGRRASLAELGLDAIGLDPDARFLDPDDHLRVAPGVWALGDATGKGAFTHMSVYQAGIVARDVLGSTGPGAEYHAVPRVTFTDPEIGVVGLTEAQARERGVRVRVGYTDLASSPRGWIHGPGNTGLIKLVEDADAGVLVGATSVGPWGGEVLSALAVAVHARVPTERLRHMIYAYPTFHRAIEDALGKLG